MLNQRARSLPVTIIFWLVLQTIALPVQATMATPDDPAVDTTISLQDGSADLSEVTIVPGDTVTWRNDAGRLLWLADSLGSQIFFPMVMNPFPTAANLGRISIPRFNSAENSLPFPIKLRAGESVTGTFSDGGVYTYHQIVFPAYSGQVTVADPQPPLFARVLRVADPAGHARVDDAPALDLGTGDGEDFTLEAFLYVPDDMEDDSLIDLLVRKDESYGLYISFNEPVEGDPEQGRDVISLQLWRNIVNPPVRYQTYQHLEAGWRHLAVVFDNERLPNEDVIIFYLDGEQVGISTDADPGVDWTPGIPNSDKELLVGGVPFGAAGFSGYIDEMRFSDIVRYDGATYTVPDSPFTPDANTRALWHFDETPGSTLFADSSGNGSTLTGAEGAATFEP